MQFCKTAFSQSRDFRWQAILELIQKISESEQTKLFRGGLSLYTLMISTTENLGLEKEDAYIYVSIEKGNLVEVGYHEASLGKTERVVFNNDELFAKLQPLLERLWDETRGKKNA